jgi:hypothetical protein
MLKQIAAYIQTRARKPLIIPLLAALGLWVLAGLPITYSIFPDSVKVAALDAPHWQSPEEIRQILHSWSPQVRNMQVWFHLTWDLVFPVLIIATGSLVIAWLMQRIFPDKSNWQLLNLLPFGMMFDLLENGCIVWLILQFPDISPESLALKPLFTLLKFSIVLLMTLVIALGLLFLGIQKQNRRE